MERHTAWCQLVAVVLVAVGLVTLAAPAPAQAMDPQLIMALASTAGAIALVIGYLIVANGREKQRAASLEGIYACSDRIRSMGCGGRLRRWAVSRAAAPRVRWRRGPRAARPARPRRSAHPDPGPMGCGARWASSPSL
jgi:hypothetical protein